MAEKSDGSITIDTRLDTKGFEKGSKELMDAIQSLTTKINQLGEKLQSAFSGAGKAAETLSSTSKQMESGFKQADKQAEKLNETIEKTETGLKQTAAANEEAASGMIPTLQAAEKAAGDTAEKVAEVGKAASESAAGTEELRKKLDMTTSFGEGLRNLRTLFTQMQASMAESKTGSAEAFTRLSSQAEEAGNTIKGLKDQMAALESMNDPGLSDTLQTGNQALSTFETLLGQVQNHLAESVKPPSSKGWETFSKAAAAAGSSIKRVAGTAAVKSLSVLKTVIRGTAAAAAGFAKTMSSQMVSGIKGLIRMTGKAASALFGLRKANGTASNGFSIGLGTVMKYAFSVSSLMNLAKKAGSVIKEGLGNLSKVSKPVNTAMSSMQSSMERLKNSLTSAFSPIITAVAPAVSALINMLADAVTYIGAFIAALTGQKTFMKAQNVQKDYAASLKDTASAAGSAADALKEEKRQLAGFDKLNVLSGSDSGSGSGGSGSGAGSVDPSTLYEETTVAGGIADYIGKLKEMFAEGDYTGIGESLAGGINGAFERASELISWENVKGKVSNGISAICGIFNGLVSGIEWETIGGTFGTGINTITNAVKQIESKIDWDTLGRSLSQGLNGLVNKVNWNLLGNTLGGAFSAKLTVITSAIDEFDWDNAGTQLAAGVNSFATTIRDTLDKTDWNSLGSKMASGINKLIKTVNWSTIGATVGSGFNSVLGTVSGALNTFDWTGAGTELGKSVNGLFNKVKWTSLGQTLSKSITGPVETALSTIQTIDWKQVGTAINQTITGFLDNTSQWMEEYDWESLGTNLVNCFGDLVTGLDFSKIASSAAKLLGTAIKSAFKLGKSVLTGIGEAIAGYLGLDKNDTWKTTAGKILSGIVSGLGNIAQWAFNNIIDPLMKALLGEKWDKIKETAWNIWKKISEGWTNIKNKVLELSAAVKEKAADLWNKVKNGWNDLKDTVVSFGAKVKNEASTWWSNVKSFWDGAKNAYTTIKAKVTNKADEWWQNVKGFWDGAKNAYTTIKAKVTNKAEEWWKNVKGFWDGAKGAYTTIKAKVQDNASSWWENTKAFWNQHVGSKSVGEFAANVKNKASEWWENVKKWWSDHITGHTVSDFVANVKDKASDWWENVKSWWSNVTNNQTVKDFVANVQNNAKIWWNRVQTWWTDFQNKPAIQFVVGVINNAKEWWDNVKKWWDEKVGELKTKLGIKLPVVTVTWSKDPFVGLVDIPAFNVTWNAKGGILNGATLFGMLGHSLLGGGEAGKEAVLPLERHTEWMDRIADKVVAAISSVKTPTIRVEPIGGSDTLLSDIHQLAEKIHFFQPAVSAGTVLPYSVARGSADVDGLTDAITLSNDQMTDIMVQAVASAANLIVQAIRDKQMDVTVDASGLTQRTINAINRQTVMYQTSPLKG